MLQIGSKSAAADAGKVDLNMTPMIDVVFQLLIFFMVTLKLPREEAMIETELPKAKGPGTVKVDEVPPPEEEFEDIRLIIYKDRAGMVQRFVNDMTVRTDGQLLNQLTNLRNLWPNGRVIVICADEVPYKHLVRTISIVQTAQLPIAFGDYK